MLYITIDSASEQEDWEKTLYERIIKGISNFEKEGYTVERYEKFGKPSYKRMFTVSLPADRANNEAVKF